MTTLEPAPIPRPRSLLCCPFETGRGRSSSIRRLADESPQHLNFSPESLGGGAVRMVMIVEDPQAAFDRAVAAGATVVWPVNDEHGWRIGRVADPFGHHWEIGQPLKQPTC